MSVILFSRPAHDGTLAYLFYYSDELVKFSKNKKHKTLKRDKEQANQKELVNLIKKQKPNFIIFNGHGEKDKICGHKNEIIISKNNSKILSNSIVYSLTCSSGKELGKMAVKNGCICFIGYNEDFNLGKNPDSEASPSKDKIAKFFLEPSNLLVKSLIGGASVKTSIEIAKEKMAKDIWYLSTTKDFPEAQFYAPFLMANYLSLVAHGDQETNIF